MPLGRGNNNREALRKVNRKQDWDSLGGKNLERAKHQERRGSEELFAKWPLFAQMFLCIQF